MLYLIFIVSTYRFPQQRTLSGVTKSQRINVFYYIELNRVMFNKFSDVSCIEMKVILNTILLYLSELSYRILVLIIN